MAAEHFCALVRRHHPDVSLSQLERNAGVQPSKNPLRHWFRADVEVDFPPHSQTIYALERITGIEAADIYLAFRRDSKQLAPKTDAYELDSQEREWVDQFRDIPPQWAQVALRMVASLREQEQATAS